MDSITIQSMTMNHVPPQDVQAKQKDYVYRRNRSACLRRTCNRSGFDQKHANQTKTINGPNITRYKGNECVYKYAQQIKDAEAVQSKQILTHRLLDDHLIPKSIR
eukprot:33715_1